MATDIQQLFQQVQSLSPDQQLELRQLLDESCAREVFNSYSEFLAKLVQGGLISEIKKPGNHPLPMPRKRVAIKGKPLSETVIEDRR